MAVISTDNSLSFSFSKIIDASCKKADTELNIVYNKLIKTLNNKERQLLIKAEKNWIKFRDSHCEFEGSQYEGGSIYSLIYSNCLTELTCKRIAELKANIENRNL